jgi:hypothetical protein
MLKERLFLSLKCTSRMKDGGELELSLNIKHSVFAKSETKMYTRVHMSILGKYILICQSNGLTVGQKRQRVIMNIDVASNE